MGHIIGYQRPHIGLWQTTTSSAESHSMLSQTCHYRGFIWSGMNDSGLSQDGLPSSEQQGQGLLHPAHAGRGSGGSCRRQNGHNVPRRYPQGKDIGEQMTQFQVFPMKSQGMQGFRRIDAQDEHDIIWLMVVGALLLLLHGGLTNGKQEPRAACWQQQGRRRCRQDASIGGLGLIVIQHHRGGGPPTVQLRVMIRQEPTRTSLT